MDNPSPNPKQQIVDRLKAANNVLVTVSANPSVDQLASCIGLTLWLNKLGKHATAVFSGEVPSTLEFLKPGETLEKTTDSLRDFIISLDKAKADKLRYKVEDKVVKIFITPYRTNLSADDLEFSQGDFNVDVIVALGVKEQQDLDDAIVSHGRILHDATVVGINAGEGGSLGNLNWSDGQASSLCELAVDLGNQLGKDQIDNQIATALLTGIVAETARFSNAKTTPQTMSVSAELMSAGANQQLVASKLEGGPSVELRGKDESARDSDTVETGEGTGPQQSDKPDDGTLEIGHPHDGRANGPEPPLAEASEEHEDPETHIANGDKNSKIMTEPPTLGGTLTANTEPESYDPTTDPMSLPDVDDKQLLSHDEPAASDGPAQAPPAPAPLPPAPQPDPGKMQPPPFAWTPPSFVANAPEPSAVPVAPIPPVPPLPEPAPAPSVPEPPAVAPAPETPPAPAAKGTLSDIEQSVGSSHLDAVRSEIEQALNSVPPPPEPVQALNAHPVDLQPPAPEAAPAAPAAAEPPSMEFDPANFGAIDPGINQPPTMPLPPTTPQLPPASEAQPADPSIPPVPPPLFPLPGQNSQNQQ